MSLQTTFIFDNSDELIFDESKIVVITTVDDTSTENPFISGTVVTPGAGGVVDGDTSSGYITNSGFIFVSSGSPFVSSGEILTFDFGTPRKIRQIDVYQNPDNYAVDYEISADTGKIIDVKGSSNSGLISHKISHPVETETIILKVTKINPVYNTYSILEVSGAADLTFVESLITSGEFSLTASSVVEPVQNLYDNNSLTFWQSNNSMPQWVLWNFSDTQNISKFQYTAEDTVTYPTAWNLQSSLDGTTFTTVYSSGSITSGDITVQFDPPFTTNYLKWNITASVGTKVRIRETYIYSKEYPQTEKNEIQLKETIINGMTDAISVYASSESGTAVIANAIQDTGYWQSTGSMLYEPGSSSYIGNIYILADLGTAKTVDALYWMNDTGDGRPVDFSLQGSLDNITYTTIRSWTGNFQNECSAKFEDVNTYRFYRFTTTRSNNNFVRLNLIRLDLRTYPAEGNVQLPYTEADSIKEISTTITEPFPATDVSYILDVGGKPYWWDGSKWNVSNRTALNSNDIATVNANAGSLSTTFGENFKSSLIVVMTSNGTDTPVLKSSLVKTSNEKNSIFIPKNLIRIRGFLSGYPGTLAKPILMEIALKRSTVIIDAETIGYSLTQIYSDNTGFFDFNLPRTELGIPAKSPFVIRIPSINLRLERYTPNLGELSLADWLAGRF